MTGKNIAKIETDLFGTLSFDISSTNSGYIFINAYRSVGSVYGFSFGISSQQQYFEDYKLAIYYANETSATRNLKITKIWLE